VEGRSVIAVAHLAAARRQLAGFGILGIKKWLKATFFIAEKEIYNVRDQKKVIFKI